MGPTVVGVEDDRAVDRCAATAGGAFLPKKGGMHFGGVDTYLLGRDERQDGEESDREQHSE